MMLAPALILIILPVLISLFSRRRTYVPIIPEVDVELSSSSSEPVL
jgi:hypothetical protein